MTIPLYQVDAFTVAAFSGNPAAVCLLSDPKEDQWMQALAQEMNLSETAYLLKQEDGYSLRWFTPATEVDLCGHATLASAHILYEIGQLDISEQARFFTRSGLLTAEYDAGVITLDFPAQPPSPVDPPEGLTAVLGVEPTQVVHYNNRLLLELPSVEAVQQCRPDFQALVRIPLRGLIITAPGGIADTPFDFVSRFFGPWMGINEDPVTGSAHCLLTPYWGARLGKQKLLAYQASARGGVLHLEWVGNRVRIGGQAVTVFKGDLLA